MRATDDQANRFLSNRSLPVAAEGWRKKRA
jgi:hypothetical protein